MRLLVVDDGSMMQRITVNASQRLGYENVLEAKNSVLTWQLLDQNDDIDMLITDWNMPEMNGLDLVRKTRLDERFVDIPIIMATIEGGKSEAITAISAGVNNDIVKPFTPQVFKEKLEIVLGIHEE